MNNNTQNIQDPSTKGVEGLKGLQGVNLDKLGISSIPEYTVGQAAVIQKIGRDITPLKQYIGNEEIGKSKYDKRATTLADIKDLNEFRAEEQSAIAQIGAGIVKGTILAGTTFADGVAGTVVGLVNVAADAKNIANSGGFTEGLTEVGRAFVNNPFSKLMQKINDVSEKAIPNYYSEAERNDPWYTNIFTANFLGDKFIKNIGFMVGAAYAGKVNAGILSKAMGLKEAREAFKGSVTLLDGTVLTETDDIVKAYAEGRAMMAQTELLNTLTQNAKKIKNAEMALKIAGSTSAAAGEARIEAISNSDPWLTEILQKIEADNKQAIDNIEHELAIEHPEWFSFRQKPDGLGFDRVLTSQEGIDEWNRRTNEQKTKYEAAKREAYRNAVKMANEIFLANVLLLSVDNFIQSGRFFSGGYSQGRNALNMLKKDAAGNLVTNKGQVAGHLVAAGISPFVEAQEEMSQAAISLSAGLRQSAMINQFYGHKIDPEATDELVNWYNAAAKGIKDTYGDINHWEEGAIGFLTGLLGMPAFTVEQTNTGRKRLKLNFEGELWEGIKEAKRLSAEQKEMLGRINEVIQSDEYKNYFSGKVRDLYIKKKKGEALEAGDTYQYKNNELEELVNWAIMFDKAGRLEDFYDNIESFANITEADIPTIRSLTIDKDGKSSYDGKTDAQIIEDFKKEAKQMKEQADKYVEISRNLKTVYGEKISSDVLEEMTYTLTQIDDWEKRFKSIADKVRQSATAQVLARRQRMFGKNEKKGLGLSSFAAFLEYNTNSVVELLDAMRDERFDKTFEENLKYLSSHNLGTTDQQEFMKDLNDLLQIYKDRKTFIDKFNTLSNHPELFTEAAQKSMKEFIDKQKELISKDIVEGANKKTEYNAFKEYIKNMVSPKSIEEALETIMKEGSESSKKFAQTFKDLADTQKAFTDILDSIEDSPVKKGVSETVNRILNHSESVDDAISELEKAVANLKTNGADEQAALLTDILNKVSENVKSSKATKAGKKTKESPKKPKEKPQPLTFGGLPIKEEDEQGDDKEDNEDKDDFSEDSIIEYLKEMSEAQLDNIIKGNKGKFSSLSDDIFKSVQKLAKKIKADKSKSHKVNNQPLDSTQGKGNADGEDNTNDKSTYTQLFISWVVTKYNITEAKGHNAVLNTSDPDLIKALDDIGVFNFVDKGYLGDLFQRDNDIEIHYILPKDDKYKGNILLAIEITPEIQKYAKHHAIEFTPIQGSDGKQYQAVGTFGVSSDEAAKKAWSDQMIKIKKEGENSDADYFVSEDVNYIKKIYSGRMVLEYGNEPKGRHSLNSSYFQDGAKLGVWYDNNWHSPIDMNQYSIVPLNTHNANSREGSIWLLTKEADGRYYAKSVGIRRFTMDEWNLESHLNTPIGKFLMEQARILVDPSKNVAERAAAKYALSEYLYIPDNLKILFKDDVISIGIDDDWNNNVVTSDNIEDRALEFLNALQGDDEHIYNIRFQVDSDKIADPSRDGVSYVNELAESDIMDTDLAIGPNGTKNINGSFDMYSNPADKNDADQDEPKTGHTGNKGIQNTLPQRTVHLGGQKIVKTNEGKYYLNYGEENQEEITDSKNIGGIEGLFDIEDGKISSVEGDKNLFIVPGGSVVRKIPGGFTVLKGKESEKALDKAAKNKEKADRLHNLEELKKKGGTPEFTLENAELENSEYESVDLELEDEDEDTSEPEPESSEEVLTFSQQSKLSTKELESRRKSMFYKTAEGIKAIIGSGLTIKEFEEKCKDLSAIKTSDDLMAAINDILHCM